MHVVIYAIGSRGDVQPLIALGLGLLKSGHSVCIASHLPNKIMIESRGLQFSLVNMDFKAFLEGGGKSFQSKSGSSMKSMFGMLKLLKSAEPEFAELFRDCMEASKGADLIISPAVVPGCHIAERLNIPFMHFAFYPFSKTKEYPCTLIPMKISLGGFLNRVTYSAVDKLTWMVLKNPVNSWRDKLQLPLIKKHGIYRYLNQKKVPYLNGFSSSIVHKPTDWPTYNYVTGYWFLEEDNNWIPPKDLVDFINQGTKPIYIGFGSMTEDNPEKLTQIAIDALKLAGRRGILLSGWSGLGQIELPDYVYKIDSVPHDWLFPEMAGVIHHGGAGTTAAAIKAGVPSLITPFLGDQFFWGNQVCRLGVGPKPIIRKYLNANSLAEAIKLMVTNEEMKSKAKYYSNKLKEENGVKDAVNIIESYVNNFYLREKEI